jgi:hypothetical protein
MMIALLPSSNLILLRDVMPRQPAYEHILPSFKA